MTPLLGHIPTTATPAKQGFKQTAPILNRAMDAVDFQAVSSIIDFQLLITTTALQKKSRALFPFFHSWS